MIPKTETPKNLTNLLKNKAAIGAAALSLTAAAAPRAVAQSGGTEAPAPVVMTAPTPSGGVEAPVDANLTTDNQTLDAQTKQDASALAEDFLKLGPHNKPPTTFRNAQGDELVSTTVTVPAKDAHGRKDGNYTFNVVSGESPDGQPKTDEVYSITASENPKPGKNGQAKPPEASVMIDQNPANSTAEVGGTYQVYPPKGTAASSEANYKSISVGIDPISPDMLHMTAPEEGAVVTEIKDLETSAKRHDPLHRLPPAFDKQGNTINDPAD